MGELRGLRDDLVHLLFKHEDLNLNLQCLGDIYIYIYIYFFNNRKQQPQPGMAACVYDRKWGQISGAHWPASLTS